MKRILRPLVVGGIAALALASPGTAGPDKIQYPANWKDHVQYLTVDRYDIKQHRELYASTQAAVDAMKAGKPLPDGTVLTLVQYKACFECHKPHEKMDYVISLAAVRGVGTATMAAPKPDVTIANFAFGPNKHTATVGQPVTWVNSDDSPHQITVVSTKERSPIITKGQSAVLPFNTAGTYDYICGLHPNMKGSVEVK